MKRFSPRIDVIKVPRESFFDLYKIQAVKFQPNSKSCKMENQILAVMLKKTGLWMNFSVNDAQDFLAAFRFPENLYEIVFSNPNLKLFLRKA